MSSIKVIAPGLFSTIQDLGRLNYQQYGMPVSGSMDHFAHKIANLLVGNAEDEALIEMTILGGQFEFKADVLVAITGANMSPMINGQLEVGMWRSVRIKKGDRLTFGPAHNGCRTYLAIAGGYEIENTLESKSTYTRGSLGGYKGRTFKKEDEIKLKTHKLKLENLEGRFVRAEHIPTYTSELELNVVLGPQEEAFTAKGIADFFSETFKITNEFDRMGYRLEGKKIEHVNSADIISDGIVSGAVQIPAHGNPIIMLSDCQTTGGYTKIAHVITVDLSKLAQAKAGDVIKFKALDIEEAHQLHRESAEKYEIIKAELDQFQLAPERNMKLKLMHKVFNVKVNEIKTKPL
ncbi:5-oxoprolinase subunit C family protein [Fusibacter ferrireducens]|uniref:Biotin-dependent carboxyltransferase family protein n=1 Tax=Fusibacter ferrireducens TaxID=2785058 RepID=A0ABR9ZXR1_9FIRM|nr:biotin-dependent carboxyltransferase family protein [Fusibacter ferrireducens]MBF4695249.1 biotin-dependent carboxyltransferase family protein [Fusibacter ferrireducens]